MKRENRKLYMELLMVDEEAVFGMYYIMNL